MIYFEVFLFNFIDDATERFRGVLLLLDYHSFLLPLRLLLDVLRSNKPVSQTCCCLRQLLKDVPQVLSLLDRYVYHFQYHEIFSFEHKVPNCEFNTDFHVLCIPTWFISRYLLSNSPRDRPDNGDYRVCW
jgi:hypothetical protein